MTPLQRKALRARAHSIDPVVMVSGGGLSAGVLGEIDRSLKSHELIKVRVFGEDREARDALLAEICRKTGAEPVQHIGKILVIYREQPKEDSEAQVIVPKDRSLGIRRPAKAPGRRAGS